MIRYLGGKEVARRHAPRAASLAMVVMTGLILSAASARLRAQDVNSANSQIFTTGSANRLVRLPAGTRLAIKMIDPVDSTINRPGDRFRGSLEEDLMAGDVVVAPKGTVVFGTLRSESPGTGGGPFRFVPADIVLNGQMYPFKTSLHLAQGPVALETETGVITGGVSGAEPSAVAASGARVSLPAGSLLEFALDFPVALPVATR